MKAAHEAAFVILSPEESMRFNWTPNDFSPTYDVETDGNGGFGALHTIWDIPPEYPEARQIPIETHHLEYLRGDGWAKVQEHYRWIGKELK